MSPHARDRHPPRAVAKLLNPAMRVVLGSPAGRLIRGLALLDFAGRSSGTRDRVVVGWHEADGSPTVFTPARWRANFVGGHAVSVRHRGRSTPWTGTLVVDPALVTSALQQVLGGGTKPSALGMSLDADHAITVDDVVALRRAMIVLS